MAYRGYRQIVVAVVDQDTSRARAFIALAIFAVTHAANGFQGDSLGARIRQSAIIRAGR